MTRLATPLALALTASAANAGGYIPPVVLPAEVPAQVAQQTASICGERPEICALLLALLLAGLAASGGGDDHPAITPPVKPPVDPELPPVKPPICTRDCPPEKPDVPPIDVAPIPLPATGLLLGGALGALAGWRKRKQVAGLFKADPGCGWGGHDDAMPTGGYPRGSAVLG